MSSIIKDWLKKWLAITYLFMMASSQQLKQAALPLIPEKPFIVVWNAPTEQCRLRYNIDLDLSVFDIVANSNETLSGSNVTIFYHTHLGTYPYYSDSGEPINGGIPQNESLKRHLVKAESDINRLVPFKDFKGLGVIDWENWRPQWIRNWGHKTIYKDKSKILVKNQHPHWPDTAVTKEAQKEFETAGKNFMGNTLLLAEQMRPKGLWGYYLFPDCYNYDYKVHPHSYTGVCPDIEYVRNDQLLWLWKDSTVLYPSIYLDYELKSSPNALKFVHYRIKEAMRIASVAKSNYALPIFAYARPFYAYTFHVLSEADLVSTIGEASAMGVTGIVLWGSSEYSKSKSNCLSVKKYIDGPLGHYIMNVTSAVKLCSKVLCRKNGKCVRKNPDSYDYLHLSPSSFKIKTHPSGRTPRFYVTGKTKAKDIRAMKLKFQCQCYQGWTGIFCEQPVTAAPNVKAQLQNNGTMEQIYYVALLLKTLCFIFLSFFQI